METGPRPEDGTELHVVGRLVEASNATFLVQFEGPDGLVDAVYKPVAGEAPLWDFPSGTLALREVAAFQLSRAVGFDVVPDTFLIDGGPYGAGSLQLWVDHDDTTLVDVLPETEVPDGWFAVMEGVDGDEQPVLLVHADDERLRRLALFDALTNNADRKGGHVIVHGERVYGVDHGVCFHHEPKLRTVLWGWAGEPVREDERALVLAAIEQGPDALAGYLADAEIEAFVDRCDAVLQAGELPLPGVGWPAIPWPPF